MKTVSGSDSEKYRALDAAVAAAKEAGAVLLHYYENLDPSKLQNKSTRRDLVSEADVASEKVILRHITAAFPGDAIHAEESSRSGAGAPAAWFIDPLDGTTNFVHGLPEFTISIARFVLDAPVVAVVYAPKLGELYTAVAGGGSFMNGVPIHVSQTRELGDSLVATGFPYRRAELANNNVGNFNNLILHVRDLRRLGSAALDLAFVARGRFDGYWELHLERHDVAAGALLVREAGGRVTDAALGDTWATGSSILASNGHIHELLKARISV